MPYSFCPMCGARLTLRVVDEVERSACHRCSFVAYENSKPCVGVLVLDGNRVLLVRRAIAPFKGYWDIPGGFLESGEHPAAGAIREMREETGLVIEPSEMLGIFMDVYGPEDLPTLNVCYLAKVVGGAAQAGSDATEIGWFEVGDLPAEVAFDWEKEALTLLRDRLGGS